MNIKLGQRVKDKISGAEGIVIARTDWLYGCIRLTIQPEGGWKDGKPLESFTVDEPQCEIVSAITGFEREPTSASVSAPAGGRESPVRRRDPERM